jgi:hypothetical protein
LITIPMTARTSLKIAATLAVLGTLFAGYLSGVKMFTKTCAFNEPCPYVLGYPACWYGLAMFSVMAAVTLLGLAGKMGTTASLKAVRGVSAAGILFAGWLSWGELSRGITGYTLGLPTCAYGLIFYILLFALSVRSLRAPAAAKAGLPTA